MNQSKHSSSGDFVTRWLVLWLVGIMDRQGHTSAPLRLLVVPAHNAVPTTSLRIPSIGTPFTHDAFASSASPKRSEAWMTIFSDNGWFSYGLHSEDVAFGFFAWRCHLRKLRSGGRRVEWIDRFPPPTASFFGPRTVQGPAELQKSHQATTHRLRGSGPKGDVQFVFAETRDCFFREREEESEQRPESTVLLLSSTFSHCMRGKERMGKLFILRCLCKSWWSFYNGSLSYSNRLTPFPGGSAVYLNPIHSEMYETPMYQV